MRVHASWCSASKRVWARLRLIVLRVALHPQAMLELADMDGSNDVDLDEFISVMRKAGQL